MNNAEKETTTAGPGVKEADERTPEPMEIDDGPESKTIDGKLQNRKRRRRPLEGKSKTFKFSWNNLNRDYNPHLVLI